MYFDDVAYEFPQVGLQMNTRQILLSILDEDGKGGYRFDNLAFSSPVEILGFFLGYMSGPLLPESPEEYEVRMQRTVVLPEGQPAATLLQEV
jgi:hypothetical protein